MVAYDFFDTRGQHQQILAMVYRAVNLLISRSAKMIVIRPREESRCLSYARRQQHVRFFSNRSKTWRGWAH
jgi:hypothetical protein